MAKRFTIRNYGPSRQIPYKGQSITITKEKVIETDDEAMAGFLGLQDMIHVTECSGESPAVSRADLVRQELVDRENKKAQEEKDKEEDEVKDKKSSSNEMHYGDFTIPELKDLLKDRELSVKGNKADMVKALEEYDSKKE